MGGVLHLAIPKVGIKLIKVRLPFKSTSSELVLINNNTKENFDMKLEARDLINEEIDDNFKMRCLYTTLELIKDFHNNLDALPSNLELFCDIVVYLDLLPVGSYPQIVQDLYNRVTKQLEHKRMNNNLNFIVLEAKRPKALRLYEPKIEEV